MRCSIIIPTRNRHDLLLRAVHSAFKACPSDGEVLVVDDKSFIPAAQVLARESDPRLRIIVNVGESGASSTRNLGVFSASGDVVFFLDDDDEILPGYCERVLVSGGAVSQADWGFSSVRMRHLGQTNDSWRQRKRLDRGIVSVKARVRDTIAATSDGFWIRKTCFDQVGGFDPAQTIDEDTDLCVRLIAQARRPWYEPEPGMRVYRGYAPANAAGAQLTVATPISKGLQCYLRTHDKSAAAFHPFSPVRWFLASRYLRRAVKAGQWSEAKVFCDLQSPHLYIFLLKTFFHFKRLAHRI